MYVVNVVYEDKEISQGFMNEALANEFMSWCSEQQNIISTRLIKPNKV